MSDAENNESDDSARTMKSANDNVTLRKPKKMRVSIDRNRESSSEGDEGQNDVPKPGGRTINIKVPPFSADDPEIWFALLEGQFENFNITDDNTKYTQVIVNLDMQHAKAVKDIIVNPPSPGRRYKKIKTELIRRLSASHEKKVKQLLTHEELGDRKPSQVLRHLMDLAGPAVPEDFIRTIWSNRLPTNTQTVLASQPTHSLEQLGDLADRIQELTSPHQVAAMSPRPCSSQQTREIAELKRMVECLAIKLEEHTRRSRSPRRRSQQSRGSARSSSRSASSYRRFPICWYHWKYGTKANHCQKPCDYKAGNFTGNNKICAEHDT